MGSRCNQSMVCCDALISLCCRHLPRPPHSSHTHTHKHMRIHTHTHTHTHTKRVMKRERRSLDLALRSLLWIYRKEMTTHIQIYCPRVCLVGLFSAKVLQLQDTGICAMQY